MSYTCHSGGCAGADMMWENEGNKYGVTTIPYSFAGHVQDSPNPHILTVEELLEGWDNVLIAEQSLKRKISTIEFNPYIRNLLSRNWFQVKNSTVIYAVGMFNNRYRTHVEGGTGWAVQMAKDNNKPIFIYNQQKRAWYVWSYQFKKFIQYFDKPVLVENFAGIGTRRINDHGLKAIQDIYKNTFE